MGLLPENNADRISWFTSRTPLWTTNATAIGTTSTQVTAVSTAATAASAALAAQVTAQNAAKAATETLNEAMRTLTNVGNVVIDQVRTKARTAGDSVYPLANIPVPATPAPKPAPGKPTDLVVTLDETGVLFLKWKCSNPPGTSGTIYQVWRKIGASGALEYLGGSGTKAFTDDSVPKGSSYVMYQIQAVRSTAVGMWATFNVNFGVDTGGGMTAMVSAGPEPTKVAA
jgi:hypothetical protein